MHNNEKQTAERALIHFRRPPQLPTFQYPNSLFMTRINLSQPNGSHQVKLKKNKPINSLSQPIHYPMRQQQRYNARPDPMRQPLRPVVHHLVEAVLAGLLMIACSAEIIVTIKMQGAFQFNTKFVIELFMLLSLIFNFAHSIDGSQNLSILQYLQLFFASLFLLTIFYYVGDNILKAKPARIALHIFYAAMMLFDLSILIIRKIHETKCEYLQMIYLVMNCISVFISLLIFVLYCVKSQEEKKMQLFYTETLVNISSTSSVSYNRPFCRMWILISTNFICEALNLIQTIYLMSIGSCKFSKDPNKNTLFNFVFLFFDYYMGSLVTLLVLRKIRIMETQIVNPARSQSFSNQVSEANKLELIANMSSRSSAV